MSAPEKPKPAKKAKPEAAPVEQVIAFKAFKPDLTCTGGYKPFQYAIGQSYDHAGTVKACSSGFHACENPFDTLNYYPLVDESGKLGRFARVTLSGAISRHSGDSKVAGVRITIDAELRLPDFINAGVDWLIAATKAAKSDLSDNGGYGAQIGSSGYGAQIGSSGNGAQIGSSGNRAQIGSSGYGAHIGSFGNRAQIGSSGNDAQIGSSGYGAHIGSSGNDAHIGSSGYGAQIGSSGNGAQIGSSGNRAHIGSSGYGARIGSSGNDARIGSSGYDAQIGSSGYEAHIGSSGNGAQIGSSGNRAQITAEGEKAVIACAGRNATFSGKAGAWFSLADYNDQFECIGFVNGCIGKDGLKPDTAYRARDGKLVEVSL